jgi:hypothetical protein
MRLLIKYPTRNRKEKFFSTLDKYYSLSSNPNNLFFLISLDENDISMNNSEVLKKLDGYKNLKYFIGNSKSKIDAVNRDIEKYNLWEILMIASDDMIPQVKGYDEIIIEKMKTHYPNTDGVVWFNDGNQKNKLNTLCILGKKYYERFNYVYHPDYKSCWSDNEFTEVSKKLNKQTYFDQVIIKHEHPDWGFGKRDEIYHKNVKDWNYDVSVYNSRKSKNFDL